MTDRVTVGNLRVARVLHDFVNNEALPGTGIDPDSFWAGVDKVVTDLAPQNQDLLARRDELQAQIDKWHRHVSSSRSTPRHTSSSSPKSATCSLSPKTSPSPPPASTTRSPRPRGRSWWCPCSTRGSR